MTALAPNHYLEETIVHWKHIAPIIHEPQNHAEYEKLANMLDESHQKPLQQESGIVAPKISHGTAWIRSK